MISFLVGTVTGKDHNRVVLQTAGGVGYAVAMTPLEAAKLPLHEEARLYTYLKVSDSDLQLYGFRAADERSFFSLLLTVSGVGPKTAMNVLALGSIDDIQSAIARGDIKYLTAVQGLGKKIAERLVVELKSKVQSQKSKVDLNSGSNATTLGEVIDALESLGYGREEAKATVITLDNVGKTTEQLLRLALRGRR
ncbi:MAG: Holliday junction branch migration protein RuvA [Candidatus Magasanikbacteria bacterium]|nr:Holliday junction branch migration protein RuvA [Candidatus Magasanikbacteria bacterium]